MSKSQSRDGYSHAVRHIKATLGSNEIVKSGWQSIKASNRIRRTPMHDCLWKWRQTVGFE
eukprot:6191113-Pyramimonas_sp.AAC.1